MNELRDKVFARALTPSKDPSFQYKEEYEGMTWENWIEAELCEYLEMLPYSKLDLIEYITDLLNAFGGNSVENVRWRHFIVDFVIAIEEAPDNSSVSSFLRLCEEKNAPSVVRALGMIYMYHKRRQMRKPKIKEAYWKKQEGMETLSSHKVPGLAAEEAKKEAERVLTTNNNKRDKFLAMIDNFRVRHTKMGPHMMEGEVTSMRLLYDSLDEYSKRDVLFCMENVQDLLNL